MSSYRTTLVDTRKIEPGFGGVLRPGFVLRLCELARYESFGDRSNPLHHVLPNSGVARLITFRFDAELTCPQRLCIHSWLERVGRTGYDIGHRIFDEDGAVLVDGRILIVHVRDGRAAPLPSGAEAYVTPNDALPHATFFADPLDVDAADVVSRDFVAGHSDHDQWGHVSHARYLDFADDLRLASPAPTGFSGKAGYFGVSYEAETRGGEAATMMMRRADAGEARQFMMRKTDGAIACRGVISPVG